MYVEDVEDSIINFGVSQYSVHNLCRRRRRYSNVHVFISGG